MAKCVYSCAAAAVLALCGCGDGRTKMGVEKTEGTVMCEGQPVPGVTVYFVPLRKGESALTGKGGIGYCDSKGHFVVTTYDQDDGAVVGRHDVCVGPALGDNSKVAGKCDCGLSSEIAVTEVEVVSGKSNTFEIVMKKATRSQKAKEAAEAKRNQE